MDLSFEKYKVSAFKRRIRRISATSRTEYIVGSKKNEIGRPTFYLAQYTYENGFQDFGDIQFFMQFLHMFMHKSLIKYACICAKIA